MPINAYTGLMGSGKSYECVSSVIIPAIRAGRRVVTNVDGINGDAIRAYCEKKFKSDPAKLGTVVHCKNDDVHLPNFLPFGQDEVETFCKGGDMVCIDEAWRFWGTDKKLLEEHKIFFREHRHYVDAETKVSCDLVLMVQDISDLHRTLKVVVEVAFRTTKIKTLGWNNIYRVEMWEGYKLTSKNRVATQNKKYDKAIFPLYSSYVGGTGKEMQVDDRQNALKNPMLWVFVVGFFIAGGSGLYFSIKFFNGGMVKKDAKSTPAATTSTAPAQVASPQNRIAVTPSAPKQESSAAWRLVGTYQAGSQSLVVVADPAGRIRLEHPSAFQLSGMAMVGMVDGQRVSIWSGALPNLSMQSNTATNLVTGAP